MNNEIVKNELLNRLNKTKVAVSEHLIMIATVPCLEKCNTICYFPKNFLSIDTNEKGVPFVTAKSFPTQFTQEAAAMICKAVTNGHGESPVTASPVDFYTGYLSYLDVMIAEVNTVFSDK